MSIDEVTELPSLFRRDEAGGIRIGRSRVTIDSVLASFLFGSTAEEIATQYSTLDVADISETIAYYLAHKQEIAAYLEQRQREVETIRQKISRMHGSIDLKKRLIARRQLLSE